MRSFILRLVALAALAVPTSALAQQPEGDLRPVQIGEDDAFAVDPQRAYIFFRSRDRVPYRLLREITDTERAEHVARQAERLATARAEYSRLLEIYRRGRETCLDPRFPCRVPDRPTAPIEAHFSNPPELSNFVDVAIRPRLTAADGWSGYFLSVRPGTYSFYGQMTVDVQAGALGVCLCMGSVRFEARPGQITYVGEVQGPQATEDAPDVDSFQLVHAMSIRPHSASMPMPERFAGLNVVSAELRAADKKPNYFGVMISRMAPVEGVLGYRRDEVLDLRAQPQPAQTGGN
jgi:hypothetical protein